MIIKDIETVKKYTVEYESIYAKVEYFVHKDLYYVSYFDKDNDLIFKDYDSTFSEQQILNTIQTKITELHDQYIEKYISSSKI